MTCPSCNETIRLRPEEAACPKCGAKLRDTLEEMNARIGIEQAEHTIKRARMWLFIATGIILLNGLSGAAAIRSMHGHLRPIGIVVIAMPFALAATFLGLWWYASRNAVVATGAALALFGAMVVLEVVAMPSSLLYPIPTLLRILILVSLITGVRAALRHRQLSAELALSPPRAG